VGPLLISANRNLAEYGRYGSTVVDRPAGFQGPLAGIAAGLSAMSSETAFVCPGDCPLTDATLARRLLGALHAAPATVDVVCAHDGARRQPLHLALRAHAARTLDEYLAEGRRSVHGWLTEVGAEDVGCADLADAFRDVDSVDDLRRLGSLLTT